VIWKREQTSMDDNLPINSIKAIQDFRAARNKASLREIIRRLTGESAELLSFDEVRQKVKGQISHRTELREIPIDAIIGSVNRYQDFDRDFLPGKNITEDRWIKVEMANYGLVGLPPIEVYQIGEAYFVSDGNHRVSVAKQLGAKEIQAYVTKVSSRVPLPADIRPEDLILKSEYTEFLEHTNLDQLRPEADLAVTVVGQYTVIEEHIAVHRYFMGIEQEREIPNSEAVTDWYDKVYLPVIATIRDRGLLLDFPDRTETDLYLWLADHRAALEEEVNSQIEVSSVVEDLADQYSQRPSRVIARLGNKLVKSLTPTIFENGPAPGEWRQSIIASERMNRLFCEILTPINGREDGWWAVEQAFVVAKREGTSVNGLFVLPHDQVPESEEIQSLKEEFSRRCEENGIKGEFTLLSGDISQRICEQARHNDLVVMNVTYPPETGVLARVSSSIRNLIQKCPRPILFTPQVSKPLDHALLAYDGSLKAQEALFIAAYLAEQWKISLDVITIGVDGLDKEIQEGAKMYLDDYDIKVNYIYFEGKDPAKQILNTIEDLNSDLLLLGGYGHHPIVEVIQGSDVDEILRSTKIPLIICR
jgi:nucleotide-binding universal stress UspA family protein